MKILLVITKAEIGGAQAFILALARGLKATHQDVVVAAGDGDFLPDELVKSNINFIRLKSLKRSHNPLQIFSFVKELKQILAKDDFQVVHFNSTNTLPGAIAVRLVSKKIRTIFTIHGLSVLDANYRASSLAKILFKIYFKFFLKFIDRPVFVSRYNQEEAKKQGIATQGSVIYNGLDLSADYFLRRDEARKELSSLIKQEIKEGDYIIGSIGRLALQKNYDFLINPWSKIKNVLPTARLIIIGEGPERGRLEELIKSSNFSGDILLPGETAKASRLLCGFDLFLLPSIYEGLSISLIEAVFAGVNILASDVGGNSEVVGLDSCFQLTEASFLDKLKNVRQTEERSNIFTAQEMVTKYLKEYE